ncbi:MAG TPA: DegQ family serine endoprotease [Dongiaceae bacterium]|nr:DegQ family serine endoprotease [Dongiaceae bacterium]
MMSSTDFNNIRPRAVGSSKGWSSRRKMFLAVTALSGALLAAPIAATTAEAYPAPDSFADLAAKVTPAVVNVSSTHKVTQSDMQDEGAPFDFPKGSPFEQLFKPFQEQQRRQHRNEKVTSLGSGFIIDPAGYIVTNNHVIDEASDIEVTMTDGKEYPAKLIGTDPKTDLALLKISAPQPLPFVNFGDSDKERVGDWIMAVGNPFGLGGTVTAGIVSARGRDINAGPFDDFLQLDAAINRGNSGGPTFDTDGDVVGINTAIASPNGGSVGIGFAIPSNMAKPVIESLRAHGSVERGWLGVQIQKVTPDLAKALGLPQPEGALVADVQADSPAQKLLKTGDVVVGYNGQTVNEMRELPRLVAATKPQTKVELTVWRDHQMQKISVNIGKLKGEQQVADNSNTPDDSSPDASSGSVDVADLGASFAPLDAATRSQLNIDKNVKGVVVSNVNDDSPLAEQGIAEGDVIERIGDTAVTTPQDVSRLTKDAKANHQSVVMMLVDHQGQELFVAVKLEKA